LYQGFDEFMNLVIDDAVEVKQVTKTNEKESRRPLGRISCPFVFTVY
jgi:small nuclear ribonucleoprotein E